MFGTLSFPKSDTSKTFRDLSSSSYNGSRRSIRKFACRTCRAHKIKCNGDKSGCARCVGSKVKCVYSESESQPILSRPHQNTESTVTTNVKVSKGILSSNKPSSSDHRHDEVSLIPREEQAAAGNTVNEDPSFLENSLSSSVELGSLLRDDDSVMDLITDDATFSDLDDTLYWALTNDEHAVTPDLNSFDSLAYDPGTPRSSGLIPASISTNTTQLRASPAPAEQPSKSSGTQQPLSTVTSALPPHLCSCSCSVHLSNSLFNLNGHLRQCSNSYSPGFPCGSIILQGKYLSSLLSSHASAVHLGDNMVICPFQCLVQASNAMQLVMLVEHLVDLFATLVEQLATIQDLAHGTKTAERAPALEVRIGEYTIENAAEREAMVIVLVGRRIQALAGLAVKCREHLESASGLGECRGRLNDVVQRMRKLRDELDRLVW